MIKLTDAQSAKVATGSARYDAAAYRKPVEEAIASGPGTYGKLEADFPGVKPANVRFQLKRQIKTGEKVTIGRHAELGVCIVVA